jgi:threonine dehydrogenase-like Zn-dependent dehydrogenase
MPSLPEQTPTIPWTARQIRVAAEADVLVIGGGPTGVGAALASAHAGAKVLLIERHGMLGGMWTAGLVNPVFDVAKGWLVDQLVDRLKQAGAWKNIGMNVFDVETMAYTLERMLVQAGVDFWFHATGAEAIVEDGCVRGVLVQSKSGTEAVLGRVTIDCTGDGDIAASAGVPFQKGRESDGLMQPMTLMFEIAGIRGLGELPLGQVKVHELYRQLAKSIADHELGVHLPYGAQRSGTPYLVSLVAEGTAVIQGTHVYKVDATDAREVTRATVEARRQVHEVFLPALRHIPGLEQIRLTRTGASIGIRESRHGEGCYRLELADMLAGRRFDDAVTFIGFHIDTHEIDPDNPRDQKLPTFPPGVTRHNVQHCEVPYRCMLPRMIDGLVFAGRSISGSHHAHSAFRVTGTCMAMGQGAGLAAAMAATGQVEPRGIDGRALRRALEDLGVQYLPRGK